jgi:hypothetical protein
MTNHRIINRNYICTLCGAMRRAPADYVEGAPPSPSCCTKKMKRLSYEQTVAATRLTEPERLKWLTSGGKTVKASGKRRWKAAKSTTITREE